MRSAFGFDEPKTEVEIVGTSTSRGPKKPEKNPEKNADPNPRTVATTNSVISFQLPIGFRRRRGRRIERHAAGIVPAG